MEEFYSTMSNFELSELTLLYNSAQLEYVVVFVSVLFAYLAAAYLSGSKLTRFQVLTLSSVYSAFELYIISLYYNLSIAFMTLTVFLTGNNFQWYFVVITAVLIGALIMSLIFMAQARTRNDT